MSAEHSTNEDQSTMMVAAGVGAESSTRPPIVNPSDSEIIQQKPTTDLTQAQTPAPGGLRPNNLGPRNPSSTSTSLSASHRVDGTNNGGEENQSIVIPADNDGTSTSNVPGYQRPTLTSPHDLQLDQTIMPSARPSSTVVFAEDRSSSSSSSSSSSWVFGWQELLFVAGISFCLLLVVYFSHRLLGEKSPLKKLRMMICRRSTPPPPQPESASPSDDAVTTSDKNNTTTNCSVMSGSSDDTDGDSDDDGGDDKDRNDGDEHGLA